MGLLIHRTGQTALMSGKTLFDLADDVALRVPTSCNRQGSCHECIVELKRGQHQLSPPTPAEAFLRGAYRLACQAKVVTAEGDLEFDLPRREPRILTHGVRRPSNLQPALRRAEGKVLRDEKPIADYRGHILGLAIDLGTTTVVMNLADLETGAILATVAFENPQRFGGSDIMNRISYDQGPWHGELQKAIVSAINFEIGELTREQGLSRHEIYDVVVVGNATMRDLFFSLAVDTIGERPYRSRTELEYRQGTRETTALLMNARALGLRLNTQALVYGGPLLGSHVGADVAAGLLAVGMDEAKAPQLLVDVGTNTEVVMGHAGSMVAASCPAGPAFEGGEVAHGMPGYTGAVESVALRGEQVQLKTIGGAEPQGICGSGLIDLLAELRRNGLMNELGVLANREQAFPFAPGLSLSRADISALAQAKAANYAGQFILLRRYGVPQEQIGALYLAGGFANYINVPNAIRIGFLPDLPPERISKVGNAALEGATLLLLCMPMRQRIETLATKIEHVELETLSDFFEVFVEGCQFKPMPREWGAEPE